MEALNSVVALKRLNSGLERLGGEHLTALNKADSPKDLRRALENVRAQLGVAQRNVDKLLPVKVEGAFP